MPVSFFGHEPLWTSPFTTLLPAVNHPVVTLPSTCRQMFIVPQHHTKMEMSLRAANSGLPTDCTGPTTKTTINFFFLVLNSPGFHIAPSPKRTPIPKVERKDARDGRNR